MEQIHQIDPRSTETIQELREYLSNVLNLPKYQVIDKNLSKLSVEDRENLCIVIGIDDFTGSPAEVTKIIGYVTERWETATFITLEYLDDEWLVPTAKDERQRIFKEIIFILSILEKVCKPEGNYLSWDEFIEKIRRIKRSEEWREIACDIAEELGGEELRTEAESMHGQSAFGMLIGKYPGIDDYLVYRRYITPLGKAAAERTYREDRARSQV